MPQKKEFNHYLLKACMEIENISQHQLADRVGVKQPTVWNWLHGGCPGKDNLKKLANVFGKQPAEFCTNAYDVLHYKMLTFAHKIFERETRGDYEVRISLTALVRLLKELGVFQDPATSDLNFPESILQQALPSLEERAKAQAEIHQLAETNERAFIKEMLRRDPALVLEVMNEKEGEPEEK